MFKLKNLLFVLSLFSVAFFSSCGDDDNAPSTETITLNISGLQDLGSDYMYEGWIIVDGSPVSTGLFSVDANGALSISSFDVSSDNLDAATTFVLSIEPNPDSDPAPSAVKILGGDFSGNSSSLSINHAAALNTDFASAVGSYILATPTDGAMTNEFSGVWWLDPAAGPGATLTLPALSDGWIYEGWAVIDGTPVSTGTFKTADGLDDSGTYSGTEQGPPFPGEDFLFNAPNGLTFPTDLKNATIVISVEPQPDNDVAPFLLKPLVGGVPSDALDHVLYNMDNNATNTNPTGTVNR